jgi:S-formylglutathione hydrolase
MATPEMLTGKPGQTYLSGMKCRAKRLAAVLLLAAAAAHARVERFTLTSASLAGNPAGESAQQEVIVYLPPSYDASPQRRYPLIVLLHGIADSPDIWLRAHKVPELLDAKGPEAIVVMPNGRTQFLGSFYLNSTVNGRWEDYIANDLIAYVDAHYRTIAKPESRGVAGHSMGGFGALIMAMHRPDVFRAAYAISPCCLDAVEDIGYGNAAWERSLAFTTAADVQKVLETGDFYPVAIVALGRALSPNPQAPLLFDFPIRKAGPQLMPVEPAYTTWREAFPIRQIPRYAENLRKMKGIVIEYGLSDQFPHIPIATPAFSQALIDARVPHTLDVYAGDHRRAVNERLASKIFPFFAAMLEK